MKITVLSTYPVAPAHHGGQHRVANMIKALEAAGHVVQSVGVLGSDSYSATPGFLPFPGHNKLRQYIENPFLMEDWAIGQLAATDSATFKSLSQFMDKDADAIFCEHPWLFGFAAKYRQGLRGKKRPLLVYESHNVESDLKEQIIRAYYGPAYAATCRDLILKVEQEATLTADLISAVSESDAAWMRKLAKVPIVVAPNGVGENRASVRDVIAANEIVGNRKFALYVASGHPPNVFGFYDLFGGGVGCFGPDDRMVVAGAAGHSIRTDEKFDKVAGLSRCFIDAGTVSDSALRGLLHAAHCIFLPMKSGGGTNLKTAEALWSGRPVIATTHAMRGFEQHNSATGVYVSKDHDAFLSDLQQAMAAERFEIDPSERDKRRVLLWDETLKPMIEAIQERPKQDA